MPPLSRRGAGFDRLSVLATYVGTAVFAIAAIAAVQHPPVYGALSGVIGRVENGLAAGVIAICIYLYGRRLGSREERFRLADMLCVEMTRMRDAMPDRAPDADLGRSRTRAEYIHARTAAPPVGGIRTARRPDLATGRPPRGETWSVYAGLLNSGGLSRFEPAMQARLHALYSHVGRGEYDAAGRPLPPLIRDVAAFRDANAPFGPSHLARPLSLALSRLRGNWRGRRGAATGASSG